jgi:PAS domain S-box-containing protein
MTRPPRPAVALRTILVLLGFASVSYIVAVAAEVVLVMRPAATALEARTRDLLTDHDDIAASLSAMRIARRDVSLYAPPVAPPPPRETRPPLAEVRERVRVLLDRGASLRGSVDRANIPLEMRLLLAEALQEESAVGVLLLEAIRSIELGRGAESVEKLRASGRHSDSTTVLLSAAQRVAMQALLDGEQALVERLDALDRSSTSWVGVGALLFAVGAWLVHVRLYRPVREMEAAVQRIADGDLSAEAPVARMDELGLLAAHLNAMTAILRERSAEETRRRDNLTERFGRILDESSNGILLFDAASLRVLQANRGARVGLGYAGEEIADLTLPAMLGGIDRTTLDAHLELLRRGEESRVFLSTTQVRRDGTSVPVELTIQYSTDRESAVFVVVTEFAGPRQRVRELDQALRDFSTREQRLLAGGDPVAAQRAITEMAAGVLGAERCGIWRPEGDHRRGVVVFNARTGRFSEGETEPAPDAAGSGTPSGALEAPVRSGGREVALVRFEQLAEARRWTAEERTFAGAVADLVARVVEASERRALEHALARAQRMDSIGKLAGGVAHDFNNILTAILGNLEQCREDLPAGDPVISSIREAEQAARRAAELTRQLLTFSRNHVVESRVFDLNAVTRDADRMLRRLVGPTVEIRTLLAPGVLPVRIGPGQFEQVLVNLAVNARDAMPEGGTITITSRSVHIGPEYVTERPGIEPGDFVEVTVRDTGSGMPQATLDRVFEPFFTTKSLGEGTGLGLAVCYGIIRQAGGDIAVTSEPGRGSSFRILLPASDAPPDVPDADAAAPARGHETVLLVEDERAIRDLLTRALTRQGYQVIAAEDGEAALAAAAAHPGEIDLLLTDVVMPRMRGPEVARRLRERAPALPVLFMSGYTAEDTLEGGTLALSEFIAKPFTTDDLGRRVRALLERESAAGPRAS